MFAPFASFVLLLLGAQGVRFETQDVYAEPQCPVSQSATVEEDLAKLAQGGMTKVYGETKDWGQNRDSPEQFEQQGGNQTAHVYGEVTYPGMQQILHAAVQHSLGHDNKVSEHFKDYHFWDLGSGFGKFPMFASFMGFSNATGVELDDHRSTFASKRHAAALEAFPCYAERLKYHHASFFDHDDWSKGTQKRVIFMDSVCWGNFWNELVKKTESAEFGKDTILASLGKDNMGNLDEIGHIDVPTTWSTGSKVTFFRKHV